MSEWPYSDEDEMEIGDTGFVAKPNGWYINRITGHQRDPEGRVYDDEGHLVFDPNDEDVVEFDDEEYEWFHS